MKKLILASLLAFIAMPAWIMVIGKVSMYCLGETYVAWWKFMGALVWMLLAAMYLTEIATEEQSKSK